MSLCLDGNVVAITEKGSRKENADTVYASEDLFMVADGVGCTKQSALASKIITTAISKHYKQNRNLVTAISHANQTLNDHNIQNFTSQPVGSTIVAAGFRAGFCDIAWVGDSRAYFVKTEAAEIKPLTTDHSLVNILLQQGKITAQQVQSHPRRHVITQCLGLTNQEKLKIEQVRVHWESEALLLLCSDGLTSSVADSLILECLQNKKKLPVLGQDLVDIALKSGSTDNISVILVSMPA